MNILVAVVASSAGVFATVTSMRAITCARLQREFHAYATWDDGAPAGLRVVVATASSTASSKQ